MSKNMKYLNDFKRKESGKMGKNYVLAVVVILLVSTITACSQNKNAESPDAVSVETPVLSKVSDNVETNRTMVDDSNECDKSSSDYDSIVYNEGNIQNIPQDRTEEKLDIDSNSEDSSSSDVEAARKVAEEYYSNTVFEVLNLAVKTQSKNRIIFMVHCTKDGQVVDPDRTIELSLDGENWNVTNEGY